MKNFKLWLILLTFSMNGQASMQQVFNGSYTVPVKNSRLSNFATFKTNAIEFDVNEISFTLPEKLSSESDYTVTFERSENNSNQFNSLVGQAHCLQILADEIECKIKYNSLYKRILQHDLPETKSFLKSLNLPAHELAARIDVATLFASDPIGIIRIKL